ncbi:hypothetical protein [Microbacterium sp. NPDC058345]|uniref:hypothetical protein n=1 Tax=Microbacterium sp. NPDC058345 TaxID=3346455 RepID=UPI003665A8C8
MPGKPARRPTPAVYRRRRLAVLLVLLLVIAAIGAGVWLAVAQPWNTASGPAPTSTTTAGPTPSGTSSGSPAPTDSTEPTPSETPQIIACTAKDVEVTAVTDADTYGADDLPQLSIALANISDQDCTINVGSSTQKFTISSGSDVWWRSTDCQTDPSDMIVTLPAGTDVSSVTPVVWDRTRSSVDTCDQKNRARAPGGGASYHLAVEIGGFESAMTKQIILR